MSNEIKVFKMINGEEIIAEQFNVFGDTIELKNPAQIVLQKAAQGVGVALAPYMPYADGNVSIYKNSLSATCVPTTDLVNEYNRIFGSGIVVPPAGTILTPTTTLR